MHAATRVTILAKGMPARASASCPSCVRLTASATSSGAFPRLGAPSRWLYTSGKTGMKAGLGARSMDSWYSSAQAPW